MSHSCKKCEGVQLFIRDVSESLKSMGHDVGDCLCLKLDSLTRVGRQNPPWTPLSLAAHLNHVQCLKILIESGADVNTGALSWAVRHDKVAVADMLIKAGANVNLHDVMGVTSLMNAASKGNHDCIKLLVESGADVNKMTIYRAIPQTALSMSVDADTLQLLIEAGADVNAPNRFHGGIEAISRFISVEQLRVLYRAGAKVNIYNIYNVNNLKRYIIEMRPRPDPDVCMVMFAAGDIIEGATVEYRNYLANETYIGSLNHHPVPDFLRPYLGLVSNKRPRVQTTLFTPFDLGFRGSENYLGPTSSEKSEGSTEETSTGAVPYSFYYLKNLCRVAIRKHLLSVDLHTNLFARVPLLGLPATLARYLLYDIALDAENNGADNTGNL